MNNDAAEKAFRGGHYNDAKELLRRSADHTRCAFSVEVEYVLGNAANVLSADLSLVNVDRLPADERARAAIALGSHYADDGSRIEGLRWLRYALQRADETRDLALRSRAAAPPALLSPEIPASRRTTPALSPAAPEIRGALDQPLPAAMQVLEQSMIRHALRRAQGRVEEAARLLGISRKGLFLKRRRWGLAGQPAEITTGAPGSPADYAG